MPEISRFLGIVITMYFNDHNPPHFHVRYETGIGRLSRRRVCSPKSLPWSECAPMMWVTEAKALPDYRLQLRFSDGAEGEIDLRVFIESDTRPIVKALRDRAAFAAIRVEMDTVVWANGFDLAPEFLRERMKPRVAA